MKKVFTLIWAVLRALETDLSCLKSGGRNIQGENIGQNFLVRPASESSNCGRKKKCYSYEKDVFIADEKAIYKITDSGSLNNEQVR